MINSESTVDITTVCVHNAYILYVILISKPARVHKELDSMKISRYYVVICTDKESRRSRDFYVRHFGFSNQLLTRIGNVSLKLTDIPYTGSCAPSSTIVQETYRQLTAPENHRDSVNFWKVDDVDAVHTQFHAAGLPIVRSIA